MKQKVLQSNVIYKRKEIRQFLIACPLCAKQEVTQSSSISRKQSEQGVEGIECKQCKLNLEFRFKIDQDCEIIDEYMFNSLKIQNIEFKKIENALAMFKNNVYIQNIPEINFDVCKRYVFLS